MGKEALIDIILETAAIFADMTYEQAGLSPKGRREATRDASNMLSAAQDLTDNIRNSNFEPLFVIEHCLEQASIMADLPFITKTDDIYAAYVTIATEARDIAMDFNLYA